jgi:hypothetical protein
LWGWSPRTANVLGGSSCSVRRRRGTSGFGRRRWLAPVLLRLQETIRKIRRRVLDLLLGFNCSERWWICSTTLMTRGLLVWTRRAFGVLFNLSHSRLQIAKVTMKSERGFVLVRNKLLTGLIMGMGMNWVGFGSYQVGSDRRGGCVPGGLAGLQRQSCWAMAVPVARPCARRRGGGRLGWFRC